MRKSVSKRRRDRTSLASRCVQSDDVVSPENSWILEISQTNYLHEISVKSMGLLDQACFHLYSISSYLIWAVFTEASVMTGRFLSALIRTGPAHVLLSTVSLKLFIDGGRHPRCLMHTLGQKALSLVQFTRDKLLNWISPETCEISVSKWCLYCRSKMMAPGSLSHPPGCQGRGFANQM